MNKLIFNKFFNLINSMYCEWQIFFFFSCIAPKFFDFYWLVLLTKPYTTTIDFTFFFIKLNIHRRIQHNNINTKQKSTSSQSPPHRRLHNPVNQKNYWFFFICLQLIYYCDIRCSNTVCTFFPHFIRIVLHNDIEKRNKTKYHNT